MKNKNIKFENITNETIKENDIFFIKKMKNELVQKYFIYFSINFIILLILLFLYFNKINTGFIDFLFNYLKDSVMTLIKFKLVFKLFTILFFLIVLFNTIKYFFKYINLKNQIKIVAKYGVVKKKYIKNGQCFIKVFFNKEKVLKTISCKESEYFKLERNFEVLLFSFDNKFAYATISGDKLNMYI